MILDDGGRGPTLDDLFRRAGVRHPHALALVDAPDRERFTDGAPRALTYSEADRAISAFAAKLRSLGLHADTVVGLQLPNSVESVIALLGVLRAGMIAALLPLLWRQRDLVHALDRAGAKVIVTSGRIGEERHAELAMQVAAELFPIRYVCAFGTDADGVVPLDDVSADAPNELIPAPHLEQPGAHVAVLTFEAKADGIRFVARSHSQLATSGAKIAGECGLPPDGLILSAVPLTSFAALSAALVPWLLRGGTLHLHHGFAPQTFAAQCAALDGSAVVVPAPALPALARSLSAAGTVIALWRAPERMSSAPAVNHGVIDLACFGETGLLATPRDANGAVLPLPFGVDTQRTKHGTLALRATGTEHDIFPPADEPVDPAASAFADTGHPCQADPERGTLIITGGPPGLAQVGGYRFERSELDALVAEAALDATIAALPHAILGERLAGSAPERANVEVELTARGLNPLIAAAFRARGRVAG
jgi:hypothetical protein